MAEMVERVARALCDDTLKRWRSPIALKSEPWREFIPAARAAIEAMRSPTEAMRSAVDKAEDEGGYIAAAYEHIEWDKAWPVAIDAALE